MDPQPNHPPAFLGFLEHLLGLAERLPDECTELGRLTREWLKSNWEDAREGLLARSTRLRVRPAHGPAPTLFRFEIERAFKRRASDGSIELASGPITGTIAYRPDLFTALDQQSFLVLVDTDLALLHPNVRDGLMCLGDLPAGPYALDRLLLQVYAVLSYENRSTSSALDPQAARYFATAPDALEGLQPVQPLWGPP